MVDRSLLQTPEPLERDDAVREEYLSLDEPIREALAMHLNYIRTVNDVEPTPAAIASLRNDLALQYHHGGNQVLCRRTERGVTVAAVGWDAVKEIINAIPVSERSGYAIEFPAPW